MGDDMIRFALLAIAVAFAAPLPAVAQTASATSQPQEQSCVAWLQRTMAILDDAGKAATVFASQAGTAPLSSDRAAMIAHARSYRQAALSGRAALAPVRAAYSTNGPFAGELSPELREMVDVLYRDTGHYIANIDSALSAAVEVSDAVEKNDTNSYSRAAPKLRASAQLLISGQVLTMRARQALISPTESAHHALAALAEIYSGTGELAMNTSASATPSSLRTTAAAAAVWIASGRIVTSDQRAEISDSRQVDRAKLIRENDLEEKALAVLDQMIAALGGAATELDTPNADAVVIRRKYLAEIGRLELEYQSIAQALFESATLPPPN